MSQNNDTIIMFNNMFRGYVFDRSSRIPASVTRQVVSTDLPEWFRFYSEPQPDRLNIDMDSASQAAQLGYATAEFLRRLPDGDRIWTSREQGGKYILMNRKSGEAFRIEYIPVYAGVRVEDGTVVHDGVVARHRIEVRQRTGDTWGAVLPISRRVDEFVNDGDQLKVTAHNWYSILAAMLTGKIAPISGKFNHIVTDGMRKRIWENIGGLRYQFPKKFDSLIRTADGWVYERPGKPNIPCQFANRKLEEQFVRAAFTEEIAERVLVGA